MADLVRAEVKLTAHIGGGLHAWVGGQYLGHVKIGDDAKVMVVIDPKCLRGMRAKHSEIQFEGRENGTKCGPELSPEAGKLMYQMVCMLMIDPSKSRAILQELQEKGRLDVISEILKLHWQGVAASTEPSATSG